MRDVNPLDPPAVSCVKTTHAWSVEHDVGEIHREFFLQ